MAAGNTGREYPKAGVFNEGGAQDIAISTTYRISMTDGNRQEFDSERLEEQLADALQKAGFEPKRVASEREADLRMLVRVDPVAGEQGAGVGVSVMVNPDRTKPTRHQLAFGFSGVAETPEAALAKFAKALVKGIRDAKPVEVR